MPVTFQDVEARLGVSLPQSLREVMTDPSDPIHKRKVLLALEGNCCQSIIKVNEQLRELAWKKWPAYLIAFATNECGDYFAFDSRTEPYRVYYIDPNDTVPESVASNEKSGFVFESFDMWYEYEMSGARA
jgi:hypothetical protein